MELKFVSQASQMDFDRCEPLSKGWSRDRKYRLHSTNGESFLLRISEENLFEKKKKQYEMLEKIAALAIRASAPVAFGRMEDGSVFTLLTWLDGEEAQEVLPTLSAADAFVLGQDAGKTMKKLHRVPIVPSDSSWWDSYCLKIERKIRNFQNCPIPLPKKELVASYVLDNMEKVKNRPTLFQHGDYHCGNMIVNNGKIGIIDFDKNGSADPYDEFKCFCWNVYAHPAFECGLINGYFDGAVPPDFFGILALYAAESMLGHITWAMRFGEAEIQIAKKVYEDMFLWFDDFHKTVPSWFAESFP